MVELVIRVPPVAAEVLNQLTKAWSVRVGVGNVPIVWPDVFVCVRLDGLPPFPFQVMVTEVVPAGCVTATCLVMPPPDIVMVPVRWAPVLAVALIRNEPLPVRFVGVTLETVSQLVALLVGAFQVKLDVTLMVTLPPAVGALQELDDTVSVLYRQTAYKVMLP